MTPEIISNNIKLFVININSSSVLTYFISQDASLLMTSSAVRPGPEKTTERPRKGRDGMGVNIKKIKKMR